ncbi:MFS transporter [Streptomyces acidicola]|uniref:MFS transporter n=1 Tax=Streptomyces acidicola TaxID=2596892 RepID=A0A5N8WVS4_9ACTN|nr:MFS transporter [Streptomyces acidicola]MPY50916.1 MFS transporter [Streptomyces acidicola]
MPQPPADGPRSPLLTVTADTLVAADFSPRRQRPSRSRAGAAGPLTPYRRLFALPGTRAFTVGGLLARLPMGMFSVSAVVMIAGSRGSYALAGAVTATGLAATALLAPWTARLIDRHGQARVAVPATVAAVLCSMALVLCVRYGAPDWTLFLCYAATATTPNTGGMSRARWAHLLRDDAAARHTANSFEQAADELCFMLGPILAAFLCTAVFPEAGTLVGAVLLLTGVMVFAAQRSTEPPASGRPASVPGRPASASRRPASVSRRPAAASSTASSPLRAAGMRPLLAVCLAMGAVFGAMEVVTIAFADAEGRQSVAGVVLGLQAAGSCAAGLVFGALKPGGSASRRLPWCVAAMTALMTLPLLAATLTGSLTALAVALLLAGMATAPTMITTMTLVQQRTPEGRLNEGMTLAVTGLLGGIACGAAVGGRVTEQVSATAGYWVPVAASLTAVLIAVLVRPRAPRAPRAPRR